MNFLIAQSAAIHTVVQDWSNRVLRNGGALPSGKTQRAFSDFMKGMDIYGLTPKVKAMNCFAPDNLIAGITPLIKTYGNDPWTNASFLESDLTINGLKGDGSSKWLNTGVIPSASMTLNNGGLTLYNTIADTGGTNEFAAWGGGGYMQLLCNFSGTTYFDSYTNGGTGRISGTPLTNGLGFTSGNRTDSSNEYIYIASSTTPFTQTAGPGGSPGSTVPTVSLYLYSANNGGSAQFLSSKRFSFAAIHDGLTAGQAQSLYNLVQAMRQQLGGGWV